MHKARVASLPFDIDHGTRKLPPPAHVNAQNGTGYAWNGVGSAFLCRFAEQ
jgi:hypothetical protein